MRKSQFVKNEKKGAAFVLKDCPCEACGASSAWRSEGGEVVCPSFRKCGRYLNWFSEKWRAVTAPFKREGER